MGQTDPQAREATLIGEMNALKPRDMEEAMLASQFLTAHHQAQLCFSALTGLDSTSREASRLRRDAMAMQRVAIALHRALDRSQTRPMLPDAATGELRPTVPVKLPNPRRGKAAVQENPPVAAAAAAVHDPGASVAAEAPEHAHPSQPEPSLVRLRDTRTTLTRGESPAMRHETFGDVAAAPGGSYGTGAAAGVDTMEGVPLAA